MSKKRILILIPARFASSRFLGKPLAEIHGISMIQRVGENCSKVHNSTFTILLTFKHHLLYICAVWNLLFYYYSCFHVNTYIFIIFFYFFWEYRLESNLFLKVCFDDMQGKFIPQQGAGSLL